VPSTINSEQGPRWQSWRCSLARFRRCRPCIRVPLPCRTDFGNVGAGIDEFLAGEALWFSMSEYHAKSSAFPIVACTSVRMRRRLSDGRLIDFSAGRCKLKSEREGLFHRFYALDRAFQPLSVRSKHQTVRALIFHFVVGVGRIRRPAL